MTKPSTCKQEKSAKVIKYRLFNKARNKTETIEETMKHPLKFKEIIEYKEKKYKFEKHYKNFYSKHDDVVYIEV